MSRTRVASREAVATIAAANHVEPVSRSHFASVTLGGDVYFWAAA